MFASNSKVYVSSIYEFIFYILQISPPGQHALKITKLIPSKYIPIVVLKKANPDKHGVVSISATSALNNSTQVTFSKQKSTGLPFVNGNGPAALKSPIVGVPYHFLNRHPVCEGRYVIHIKLITKTKNRVTLLLIFAH